MLNKNIKKNNSYMNIFLYPFELFFSYTKISEVKKNIEDENFLYPGLGFWAMLKRGEVFF
jgi:hypothetical protein